MKQQSNDPEYATAVAAAAYAIKSLEETIISDQKKKKTAEPPPQPAPTTVISKREATSSAIPASGRFSGETAIKISEGTERKAPIKSAEIPLSLLPPLPRNTPSEKPAVAPDSPPPLPPVKEPATRKAWTKWGRPIGEIEIDVWEKTEMVKIKEK